MRHRGSGGPVQAEAWRLCLRFKPRGHGPRFPVDQLANSHVSEHPEEWRSRSGLALRRSGWRVTREGPEQLEDLAGGAAVSQSRHGLLCRPANMLQISADALDHAKLVRPNT